MSNPKINWEKRIPVLQDFASELLDLASNIVSAHNGPHKMNDFLGAMIDVFTHIQMDHLKSICILVNAGQGHDADIISRSSVEAMYLLLWSAYGPKDNPGKVRPYHWWSYLFIEEYRRMIKTDINDVSFKTETRIFEQVKDIGYLFLTITSRNKLRQMGAKSLPDDPFIRSWPSENWKDIEEELKDIGQIHQTVPHYEEIYRRLCQWTHSTQYGIGRVFNCNEEIISHNSDYCIFMGARALELGYEALDRSLVLFNDHFDLDFRDRIVDLESRYFSKP